MGADVIAHKRPGIVTAVCIVGFIGSAFTVPLIFSNLAQTIGPWYPPALALSAVAGLACMVGLWMMKKWGVVAYTALFAINQIVLLAAGFWSVRALILPGIVIAIGFWKYDLMD